jgi:hypothetical protein
LGNSYANTLAAHGFAHAPDLKLRLQAWDRIFALLSADVVVADRSPTACLAARGRIPLLVAGCGFAAPPADLAAFPGITRDGPSEANQTVICRAVNQVLEARGVPGIEHLPELLAGDRRAIFTVPQLDPYHAHRRETLLRPCINIEGPLAPHEGPSLFFALPSTFPCLGAILRALERVGAAISCFVPGPRTVALAMLQHSGARVWQTRPSIVDALSDAAVVLAASPDLASAAYLAGRPQLVLRRDLETNAMASELERRRTAIALELGDIGELTHALNELLHNASFAQSALEEARRAQSLPRLEDGATLAARECLELLMRPPNMP